MIAWGSCSPVDAFTRSAGASGRARWIAWQGFGDASRLARGPVERWMAGRAVRLTFLLDTNACIAHLTGRVPTITERLRRHSVRDIVLCSIVKAELLTGAQKSRNTQANLAVVDEFTAPFVSYPFDEGIGRHERLRVRLPSKRSSACRFSSTEIGSETIVP